MDGLTTPPIVLDTRQIVAPLLESQQKNIALQEQRVKDIGQGIVSMSNRLDKIQLQGSMKDRQNLLQTQKNLVDEYSKELAIYGGPSNLPIDKQVLYNTKLQEYENYATKANEEQKWAEEAQKFIRSAAVKGVLTDDARDKFFKELETYNSSPIGERVPFDLTNFVETPSTSIFDIEKAFIEPTPNKESGQSSFILDRKKWETQFNDLKAADPKMQKALTRALDSGYTEDEYKDKLWERYQYKYSGLNKTKEDEEDKAIVFQEEEGLTNVFETGQPVPSKKYVATSPNFPKGFQYEKGLASIRSIEVENGKAVAVIDYNRKEPIDPNYPLMGANDVLERITVPYEQVQNAVVNSRGGKEIDKSIVDQINKSTPTVRARSKTQPKTTTQPKTQTQISQFDTTGVNVSEIDLGFKK